jgi:hypothetical protein
MTLAIEIVGLVVGAIVFIAVLPTAPVRRGPRVGPAQRVRPVDLERLERVTAWGRSSAAPVDLRLRPVLREIAMVRLRRRGIELDRGDDARELLGERLWELVKARPLLEDPRGSGVSLSELEALTERLESI